MSLPVPIDAGLLTCECPGSYGPYTFGASIYSILWTRTGGAKLVACKSTDGNTFTRQDEANSPAMGAGNESALYTCVPFNALIFVFTQSASDRNSISVECFNTATDLWIDPSSFGGVTPDNGILSNIGNGNFCATRRGADIIFALPQFFADDSGFAHTTPGFAVYTPATDVWSAFTALDSIAYATPTPWDLFPCGIVTDDAGTVQVFSQQMARVPDFTPQQLRFDTTQDFTVPDFVGEITNIIAQAGGAAGTDTNYGVSPGPFGGGGAGARSILHSLTVTPGQVIHAQVGTGGALAGMAGQDSYFGIATCLAKGGQPGITDTDGGVGGRAVLGIGDVTLNGGSGGSSAGSGTVGAGGGGSPTDTADGTAGAPGNTITGDGGVGGNVGGGKGGDLGTPDGSPGGVEGAAGGGSLATTLSPVANVGMQGYVTIEYVIEWPEYDGRLCSQAINPDNTLETAQVIDGVDMPIMGTDAPSQILGFDSKAGAGFVAFVISGVKTNGYGAVLLGSAFNSGTPSFDIDTIATGATFTTSPALALNTPDFYVSWLVNEQVWSSTNGQAGAQVAAGIKGSRLVSDFNTGYGLQLAWGTPTNAITQGTSRE